MRNYLITLLGGIPAKQHEAAQNACVDLLAQYSDMRERAETFEMALIDISKMPSPKANATVRRMAGRAEEAINHPYRLMKGQAQ